MQAVFNPRPSEKIALGGIRILSQELHGSVATLICAAGEEDALAAVNALSPMLAEAVSLTLEEVFIYEMEVLGYAFDEVAF